MNRKFKLNEHTEKLFHSLRIIYASNTAGFEHYRLMFEQLGDLGDEMGKGINSITVGVLMILRSYKDRKKLEALAKLTGKEEGLRDDRELHLEASRSLLTLLEEAHAAGGEGVTEEEVLDAVFALGKAYNTAENRSECRTCFERAKEGFSCLLGEDSAKSVRAAYSCCAFLKGGKKILEIRRLWERAKVTLPDEAVTFDIASQLGIKLYRTGKYEEAKVLYLAALEGRWRLLGEEHKDTLMSLNNMGAVLYSLQDYGGAHHYFQLALGPQEKVLGKTHHVTLQTVMNMGNVYMVGFQDFAKAEEMYRQGLDGREKSLGKDHKDTKMCVRSLAILFVQELEDKVKTRELATQYPHLLTDATTTFVPALLSG